MKIITLTLNPAFDVHCDCDNFKAYHESVAKITLKNAGGKGVNVSRALSENGTDNLAIVVIGKENGTEFLKALENDGLKVSAVWTNGRIRENITLHEKGKPETRISFEGFSCEKDVLLEINKIIGEVDSNTIITFTGSLSNGIDSKDVLTFLKSLKQKGAKIVIDSRSVGLQDLVDFKPWLIKPNKDETETYTKRKVQSVNDAFEVATTLYEQGVENAIISLGEDGAVLACREGVFYTKAPKIKACSTIGAGDSMIAGFIDATKKGLKKADSLKKAVAFGSAACIREGTLPPKKEDVEKMEGLLR